MIRRLFFAKDLQNLLRGVDNTAVRLVSATVNARWFGAKRGSTVKKAKVAASKYLVQDDPELSDMTAIPAGLDLYSTLMYSPKLAPLRFQVSLHPDSQFKLDGLYVIAVNVPHGATEQDITSAISSVGTPSEVTFIASDVPKATTKRAVKVASKKSALLRFESEDVFKKLTTTESKLFGILCKSSGSPPDTTRSMFFESADSRKSLILTNIGRDNTVEQFRKTLQANLEGAGMSLSPESASLDLSGIVEDRYAIVDFPSFPSAFRALKHLQSVQSPFNVSFSTFRSQWSASENRFVQFPILSTYDP